jgi:His/Glu/Gln/Arg/opine family amino acid ABC transporter permease subunit
MSRLAQLVGGDFLPTFLAGMAVNFEIAAIAVVIGLAAGLPLAFARASGRHAAVAVSLTVIGLMRAAPTFVVMFFLLNVVPRDAELFGIPIALSGVMTVAVSLVPYSAAYVADAGVEALAQWRRGSHLGALLFLPNMTRAFFVVVMSSGAAAAIGVPEGISVILRQAEHLPSLGDKLVLFAVGIVMFGVPLQLGSAFVRWLQRALGSHMTRRQASTP